MHIAIRLDPKSKTNLQMQIYEQLVDHIRSGRLKPGGILPSFRDLSEQLGVSRNTVSEAYEKLVADGYIHTAPQRGTATIKLTHYPGKNLPFSGKTFPSLFHGTSRVPQGTGLFQP
jgi:DNA-binding FadR family transcriptional regulator